MIGVYFGRGSSVSSNNSASGAGSSTQIIEDVMLEDDNPLIFVHCGGFECFKSPGSSVAPFPMNNAGNYQESLLTNGDCD